MKSLSSSIKLKKSANTGQAWTGKSCSDSAKTTLELIDTDGDKVAEKAVITVSVSGTAGYCTMTGSKTGQQPTT